MFFFEGCKCPVCGETFDIQDDVVACPGCGAPHHRQCYKDNGGCAYEDKHTEGYEWKRSEDTEEMGGEIICGVCGAPNPEGRLFCRNCSSPLSADNVAADDGGFPGSYFGQTSDRAGGTEGGAPGGYYAFGGMVSPISDGDTIEGVPVGDLKRFLGESWYYYIPQFINFSKTGKKVSFNFAALFLQGIWFISRKMYVLGGVLLSLMIGIGFFEARFIGELMPISQQYIEGNIEPMMQFISEKPLLALSLVAASVLEFAIYILSALFANRLYMRHCIRTVKQINNEAQTADQFNSMLESRGGTAGLLSLLVCIGYFALQYYIQYIMTKGL